MGRSPEKGHIYENNCDAFAEGSAKAACKNFWRYAGQITYNSHNESVCKLLFANRLVFAFYAALISCFGFVERRILKREQTFEVAVDNHL